MSVVRVCVSLAPSRSPRPFSRERVEGLILRRWAVGGTPTPHTSSSPLSARGEASEDVIKGKSQPRKLAGAPSPRRASYGLPYQEDFLFPAFLIHSAFSRMSATCNGHQVLPDWEFGEGIFAAQVSSGNRMQPCDAGIVRHITSVHSKTRDSSGANESTASRRGGNGGTMVRSLLC